MKTAINDSVGGLSGSVGQSNSGLVNVENGLKQVTTTANSTSDAIRDMREKLSNISVDRSSIDAVASDMENMGITIKEVTAELKGSNLDVTVKGIDSLDETVTIIRQLDTSTGEITQVGAKIKQSFSTSDEVVAELNKEMANFVRMQKEISNKKIEIATIKEQGGDLEYIATLERQLEGLENTYAELMQTFMKKLEINADIIPMEDINRFEDSVKSLQQSAEHKVGQIVDREETKKATADFEKLKSLAKEITNLRIDIIKSDDTADISKASTELEKLNNKYNELFAKTKGRLTNNQLSQLDNINSKALKEFNNELNEFVRLQKQIENTRFEIGKLEVTGGKQNEVVELKRQLEDLENTYNKLMNAFMKKVNVNSDFLNLSDFKSLESGIAEATKNAENRLERFKSQYADTRAELAKNIKVDIELGNYDNEMSQMYEKFNKLSMVSNDLQNSIKDVEQAHRELELANESGDEERLIQAQKQYATALEKTNNLIRIQAREQKKADDGLKLEDDIRVFQSKIDTWLTKNTAAAKQFGTTMRDLQSKAEGVDRVTLNHLEKEFKQVDNAAEKAGLKGLSSVDKLKAKFKEYSTYLGAAEVFMWVEQGLRDMFEQVKLIDTAMTELKKVTDETDASYNKFLSNAATRSKEIGTTIDGLVSSTADFARLGYEFEDAQGLAEVANIYAVVGDEIEGVEGATESLISTMAAFKGEMNGMSNTDFAMSIIDKFNEIKFYLSPYTVMYM